MTLWKKDNRSRVSTKTFAWLFSAVLGVAGLSAATHALVGGSETIFVGAALDADPTHVRSSGERAIAGRSTKPALGFSASRPATLSAGEGSIERAAEEEVVVGGALQGDPKRSRVVVRGRRLNFL